MYIISGIFNSEKISFFLINKQFKKIVLNTSSIDKTTLNKSFSSVINLRKAKKALFNGVVLKHTK